MSARVKGRFVGAMGLTCWVFLVALGCAGVANATISQIGCSNHLYFYAITDNLALEGQRCGQVDAAPHMPPALFEPRNLLALAAYAEATLTLFGTPENQRGETASALQLGTCPSEYGDGPRNYGDTVKWTPSSLMGPVCAKHCKCSYDGASGGLPPCRDEPDDPTAGTWCSLCGPTTGCLGCNNNTVTVSYYYRP